MDDLYGVLGIVVMSVGREVNDPIRAVAYPADKVKPFIDDDAREVWYGLGGRRHSEYGGRVVERRREERQKVRSPGTNCVRSSSILTGFLYASEDIRNAQREAP